MILAIKNQEKAPINQAKSSLKWEKSHLNKHAKELINDGQDTRKGFGYALRFGDLVSSFELSFREDIERESRIRELVGSLDGAFNFAAVVSGQRPDNLEFIGDDAVRGNLQKLFYGYREGPKPSGKAYVPETNVKQFCRTKEVMILNRDNPGGVGWYGRRSPGKAIGRN